MAIKEIFKMAAAAMLNSIFGHVTTAYFATAYTYRISSKSDDFSLTYGDLTIFKMAAVGHLGF